MSIRSKFSDKEIENLTKEEFMRNASYEDILEVDLKTLEVGALIRESTDKEEQKRAYAVQKDMILDLINSKKYFHEGGIFMKMKMRKYRTMLEEYYESFKTVL